jgi:hypothetical protein
METTLSIIVGIGLAASCGFRVFVPLLVTSGAALTGNIHLTDGFDWLGTWTAFTSFAIASAVEIAAYYIPWLDNLLDTIASPIGVIAGVILFAASVTNLDPFLRWSLAVIAGGGAAGVIQGGTVAARAASTATSGGLANFIVSTFEAMAGFSFPVLAIAAPIVACLLVLITACTMYYFGRHVIRVIFEKKAV